jgi:hypothetical protein
MRVPWPTLVPVNDVGYYLITRELLAKGDGKSKIVLKNTCILRSLTKSHINIKIITYLCLIKDNKI